MEKNRMIFVIKKLYVVNFLDFIWTWTFNYKKLWIVVGLGLSFEDLGLDLDRKI